MAVIGIDGRALDMERTGIGRYLENLLREWGRAPRGHAFRVYTTQPQVLEVENRVVTFTSPTQADLFSDELARAPVDGFFSPFYELPDSVTCPSVITVHDLVHEATPEAFTPFQLSWLRARHEICLPRATAILTDSRFARDEIAARFPTLTDRLSVVPLAADPRFTPAITEAHRAADRAVVAATLPELAPPYLLYVGAISGKRHIPSLLQALSGCKRLADTRLCLVGRDYHVVAGTLEQALAAARPGQVVHRPHVSNEVLVALYREALGFVYLSTYEGFGMPPLEAMACATPVLTTRSASLPEVTGGTALTVDDPSDVQALQDALEALIDAETRDDRRARGVRQAARFSWTATATATLDAIEGAMRLRA